MKIRGIRLRYHPRAVQAGVTGPHRNLHIRIMSTLTATVMAAMLSLSHFTYAQAARASAAVAAVATLYHDFAAEAVIDDTAFAGEGLFTQPRAVLAKYLDEPLVALVLKDRQCSRQSHELCRLSFSPL